MKVWCVKHNDGWCAIKENYLPKEGETNIPTACGQYIVLPYAFEQREPDCRGCK